MLIGLHGRKGAGKDTVYERITHLLGPGSACGAPVERRAFGDKVKELAAASLGVPLDYIEAHKDNPLATVEVYLRDEDLAILTFRQYVQNFAKKHRDTLGLNVWVDQVDLTDHARRIVCITDVRYANEAQAISDAGGVVLRVHGPIEVEEAGDTHESEQPLAHALVDYAIFNTARDDHFRALDGQVMELVCRMLREERVR